MLATPEFSAERQALAEARRIEPGPFQDVPGSIWTVFLTAWGLIFLNFALFFTVNLEASFMVTISVMFSMMFFGVPAVMASQSRCDSSNCPKVIQTFTGPLSVTAAGAQIVAVPVCALIGQIAFIALVL